MSKYFHKIWYKTAYIRSAKWTINKTLLYPDIFGKKELKAYADKNVNLLE